MSKTVGYIRVSSKDKCLERQLAVLKALGMEEKYIYHDKQYVTDGSMEKLQQQMQWS